MSFSLVPGDITRQETDVIVNAANSALMMGGGVCGSIFRAAGVKQMQKACNGLAPVQTGDIALTEAFALPCKAVIHAVGPVWRGGNQGERELLSACYTKSLESCVHLGFTSIAFPLISSGIYGYPPEKAYTVARSAIETFLLTRDLDVYLVIYGEEMYRHLSGLTDRPA